MGDKPEHEQKLDEILNTISSAEDQAGDAGLKVTAAYNSYMADRRKNKKSFRLNKKEVGELADKMIEELAGHEKLDAKEKNTRHLIAMKYGVDKLSLMKQLQNRKMHPSYFHGLVKSITDHHEKFLTQDAVKVFQDIYSSSAGNAHAKKWIKEHLKPYKMDLSTPEALEHDDAYDIISDLHLERATGEQLKHDHRLKAYEEKKKGN